jgi:hypothetical protein
MEVNMPNYHGHAPGHVRDTFRAAVEAFYHWYWKRGEPEPTVEYEIHYEPHSIPISRACELVWNCGDVLPRSEHQIITEILGPCGGSYAAAARLMLPAIKERTT